MIHRASEKVTNYSALKALSDCEPGVQCPVQMVSVRDKLGQFTLQIHNNTWATNKTVYSTQNWLTGKNLKSKNFMLRGSWNSLDGGQMSK